MKSKNLIWLGLGAVALYLYFRNKPKAVEVTPKVEPIQPISPLPNLVVPKPTPLPSIKPKPSISTKYDCNWVKEDKKKQEELTTKMWADLKKRYPSGKYPIGYGSYPYFLQLSEEQINAYKNCGIEIPK